MMLGGNPAPAAPAATNLLYTGEQFDTRAQHYYLRARYYNPSNGRFNQTDPFAGNMQDPQSLHKYLYCHANPVNGTDPSGHNFSVISVVSVMAIGFILLSTVNIANAPTDPYGNQKDNSGQMVVDLGYCLLFVGVGKIVGRYVISPLFGYVGKLFSSKQVPYGFKTLKQFVDVCRKIKAAGGSEDAVVGIRGSAVTGKNYKTGKPFDTNSDYDFFVVSDEIYERAVAAGAKPNTKGLLNVRDTSKLQELSKVEKELSQELGRDTSVRIFNNEGFRQISNGDEILIE